MGRNPLCAIVLIVAGAFVIEYHMKMREGMFHGGIAVGRVELQGFACRSNGLCPYWLMRSVGIWFRAGQRELWCFWVFNSVNGSLDMLMWVGEEYGQPLHEWGDKVVGL